MDSHTPPSSPRRASAQSIKTKHQESKTQEIPQVCEERRKVYVFRENRRITKGLQPVSRSVNFDN